MSTMTEDEMLEANEKLMEEVMLLQTVMAEALPQADLAAARERVLNAELKAYREVLRKVRPLRAVALCAVGGRRRMPAAGGPGGVRQAHRARSCDGGGQRARPCRLAPLVPLRLCLGSRLTERQPPMALPSLGVAWPPAGWGERRN